MKMLVSPSDLAVHSGASWPKITTSYWADGNGWVFCSHDHSYGATSMYDNTDITASVTVNFNV